MKLCMPKQHGAWAMLFVPYWLGAAAAGYSLIHPLMFAAWVFLYLSAYAALSLLKIKGKKRKQLFKRSLTVYLSLALILSLCVLLMQWRILLIGCFMLPFLMINIYYAKKNNERAMVNDIAAICMFSIGGIASYFAASGHVDLKALLLALISILFFTGTALYVKTMIRERGNHAYKYASWIYYAVTVLLLFLSGNPVIGLAFIPGLLRAFLLYGKSLKILTVGMIEIVNALFFFCVMLFVI